MITPALSRRVHDVPDAQKRTATIVFIDMVGYSALAARDEALCLRLLEDLRQGIIPLFARHGGRLVKTIGDAFLLEFTSADEALTCALDVQRRIALRNQHVDRSEQLWIRIGVHTGTVVVDPKGDVYGDTVNTAARIEPIAEPGGICITACSRAALPASFPASFVRLGMATLKNVESRRVYAVLPPSEERTSTTRRRARFYWKQTRSRLPFLAAAVAILSLGAVPATFLQSPKGQTIEDVPYAAYEAFYAGDAASATLDIHDAEDHYRRAVEIAPLFASGWQRLSHSQRWNNRPGWQTSLDRALALKDALPARDRNLALAADAKRRGDRAAAGYFFRKAVDVNPNDPIARFELGDHLFHQGEFAAAVVQFERVLEENEQHYGAYDHILWADLVLGRYEHATEMGADWTFHDPSSRSFGTRGEFLTATGQYDAALALYAGATRSRARGAHKLRTKEATALYFRDGLDAALAVPQVETDLRAFYLFHAGQLDAGLAELARWAGELDGSATETAHRARTDRYPVLRAYQLAMGGRHEEARDLVWGEALHGPLASNSAFLLTLTCMELGDRACIGDLAQKPLVDAHQIVIEAWLAAEGGDAELALTGLRRAERLIHPRDHHAIWYLQAKILGRVGRLEEARAKLEACAETRVFYAVYTAVHPRCTAALGG